MKRYKHNLGYYNLATMDMGKLIPIGLTEALAGDTVQHHTNVVIRVSPLAAPVMHAVTARVHHFFVPHRLVWDGWENFITGGPDGNDSQTVPGIAVTQSGWDSNPIYDYFGVPRPADANAPAISALPILAYAAIFNEYYRDQDTVPLIDLDTPASIGVQNIAWEKDYFTTARPFTQRGPDVTIPLGQYADVETVNLPDANSDTIRSDAAKKVYAGLANNPDARLVTNLQTATATNVNDFRKAFALQRYQEARARYGARYVEYLRYLGVRPRDERLQRPEFLGGGNAQIQFSEVMQTANDLSSEDARFGVGDMYGHGIAAMRSNAYRRTMEEHGYIVSLLSVRPKAVYANAIDRTWLKLDKEDFFQKELQHIGQQEIKNDEVYFGGNDGDLTFGYQDRYAEYRTGMNRVTSEYRDILNYWHLAREFTDQPVLNQSFTDCVPSKRIHNEQTQHALWCMCQHKIVAKRLVDRSATPRIY